MGTTHFGRAVLWGGVAAFLLLDAPMAAAEEPIKGYSCRFPRGASQAYVKGAYRARKAQPITMEIRSIDLEAQRAELITGAGKGPLRIVRALGANHFLEVVTEGYLNITTIYDRDVRNGTHPAVHSRHFGLFGEPVIAQYTGACTSL